MRVLAIETSSQRGTVALVESLSPVTVRSHATPNAHGEHLLKLVEEVCAESGWARSSLDRVAVGIGPGSFTGLRVGIAFAQGVSIGLGRPLFGVGSLHAMADAAPAEAAPLRCPVLDARRGEVFVAAYDAAGHERLAAIAVAPDAARQLLADLGEPLVLLGEGASLLQDLAPTYRSPEADLPHATHTGRLASMMPESAEGADPLYIRPLDAIRPKLPPSPLSWPRGDP